MYIANLLMKVQGFFSAFRSSDWNSAFSVLINYIHMHPLHSPTYFFNLTENLAQAKQSERKSLQSFILLKTSILQLLLPTLIQ